MLLLIGLAIGIVAVGVVCGCIIAWLLLKHMQSSPIKHELEFNQDIPPYTESMGNLIGLILKEDADKERTKAWSKVQWDNRTIGSLLEHIHKNKPYTPMKLVPANALTPSDQKVFASRLGEYLYRCGVPGSRSYVTAVTILEAIEDTLKSDVRNGAKIFNTLSESTKAY